MAAIDRVGGRAVAPRAAPLLQQARELHRQGESRLAQSLCEELLESEPARLDALMLLGSLAGLNNDFEKAATAFGKAAQLGPANAAAHRSKGVALAELGRWEAALASIEQAIAIQPEFAEAYFSRGDVYRALGRWQEALDSYRGAVSRRPEFVEAWCNCGNVFREMEQWEDALQAYDRALAISPDNAMVLSNRGVVQGELGRFAEALASYERVIALVPDHASTRFNRAILLLSLGHLAEGWRDFEWRWKDKCGSVYKEKRNFQQPRWSGEQPIAGKTILLYSEQGYGDTLQFCRYVPLLAERGARVVLEVRAPLVSMLADLEGVSQLVAWGGALPAFDLQCPLMSLPLAFNTTLETIPRPEKYLCSDACKVSQWQATLGEKRRPRVGLAWSGNAAHANDRRRSIDLAQLLEGLPTDVQYISLQKDLREADRESLGSKPHLLNISDQLYDFSDTAALCDCLDLVICVDTSVAHLSGALGKPTWVLLPSSADWRWLLERSDTPWYRSVRLYRQDVKGSWKNVLDRVRSDLMRTFDIQGTVNGAR